MKKLAIILGFGVASLSAIAQTAVTTTTQVPSNTTAPATTTITTPTNSTTTQATTTNTTPATSTTITTTTAPVSIAQQNLQSGNAFLAANKSQNGVVTLPSGLQYKIIDPGNGPKPTRTDTVTVDYEGKHINGQIFDSSYQRGQPATFPVNGVILGWQEALPLMNTGATWELYIPAQLAYGERGVPGAIAPNETLVFKVHLISVNKNA